MSAARIASVIVALASAVAVPARAEAMCGPGAVSVWPEDGATVPPNVRFVLELYGSERDRADYLDRGGAALVSSGLRIPLSPVWRSDGEFGLTQVVLVPVFPLRAGHDEPHMASPA